MNNTKGDVGVFRNDGNGGFKRDRETEIQIVDFIDLIHQGDFRIEMIQDSGGGRGGVRQNRISSEDPLMDQLIAHLDQYHLLMWLRIRYAPVFHIDSKGEHTSIGKPGRTEFKGKLPGSSDIYIHPSAFNGQFKLFLIVGHELVHATTISDGSFGTWVAQYGLNNAKIIAEYNAYKWQTHKEAILKISYGADLELAKYKGLLPAGYLN